MLKREDFIEFVTTNRMEDNNEYFFIRGDCIQIRKDSIIGFKRFMVPVYEFKAKIKQNDNRIGTVVKLLLNTGKELYVLNNPGLNFENDPPF